MDFPGRRLHLPVISICSPESIGLPAVRLSGASGLTNSGAWPAANRALYVPFSLAGIYPVAKMWWANGGTASGNVDAGIYTADGTLLGSTGATAQTGTTIVQSAAMALTLTPGSYYMGLLLTSGTGTTLRANAIAARYLKGVGMAEQDVGAGTLPATFTLATVSTAYLPLFGFCDATSKL